MSQQHLDRLTSIDAGFLHQEDGSAAHMHIGGLSIFGGPPPTEPELHDHIERRLALLPRFRQKLAFPPLGSGRPLWVDDPSFNLRYHVRRTALPSPGNEEQLHRLVSRVFSQRLDRSKPLWELWVIEGLAGGEFGLMAKTHHAMVDGVGGIDLMTALLDLTPEPREVPDSQWQPARPPGGLDLLVHGAGDVIRGAGDLASHVLESGLHPRDTLASLLGRANGIAEVGRQFVFGAPPSPLNRSIGPHRTYATVEHPLAEYKEIRHSLNGTLNDVVLAVVAGGLRRFLMTHDVDVDQLRLRAMVPMSVRKESGRGAMGNQILVMVAPIPVDLADPVERLAATRKAMESIKKSPQAIGARTLVQMENFAPPTVLAQASRLGFSSRLYNLLVTNVPGPQVPVYFLGREMKHVYPVAFLAPSHLLAIAILSYNGTMSLGLLADADALPDIDQLSKDLDASVQELLAAARTKTA
jgi:WS/DGAT/MGAT family acyltransferase